MERVAAKGGIAYYRLVAATREREVMMMSCPLPLPETVEEKLTQRQIPGIGLYQNLRWETGK
jgi:hypothetical protein